MIISGGTNELLKIYDSATQTLCNEMSLTGKASFVIHIIKQRLKSGSLVVLLHQWVHLDRQYRCGCLKLGKLPEIRKTNQNKSQYILEHFKFEHANLIKHATKTK
jgi:hypothetical protein